MWFLNLFSLGPKFSQFSLAPGKGLIKISTRNSPAKQLGPLIGPHRIQTKNSDVKSAELQIDRLGFQKIELTTRTLQILHKK